MSLLRTLTHWTRGHFARARLRLMDGPHRGRVFPLTRRLTTLGPAGDVRLPETPKGVTVEALPAHGRYRLPAHGRYRLRAASAAGVRVNDSPVLGEVWLSPGDRLQIGGHTLRFETLSSPAATPSKRPAPLLQAPRSGEPPRFVGQELSAPALSPALSPMAEYAPAAGAVGTRLVCLRGPYTGQSFPLSHAPTTVGRASTAAISLPADLSLSRTHAEITYTGGRHLLSDTGSVNGTVVNDEPLTDPLPLVPGDVIALGDTTLRYE